MRKERKESERDIKRGRQGGPIVVETPAPQRSSSVEVGRKLEIQRSVCVHDNRQPGKAQSAPGLTSRSAERKPGTTLRAFCSGACASDVEEKRRRRCERAE
ncbi:LOW QUALITY PROTEIN: hypothetical protein RTBOTA2_001376 [Rhodotorula toruloides]|nr:LOW QUALITY PROTEIN: hypothetical protein RTBOTA2_001376 [Rhodotorula toruloides]